MTRRKSEEVKNIKRSFNYLQPHLKRIRKENIIKYYKKPKFTKSGEPIYYEFKLDVKKEERQMKTRKFILDYQQKLDFKIVSENTTTRDKTLGKIERERFIVLYGKQRFIKLNESQILQLKQFVKDYEQFTKSLDRGDNK